MKMWAWVVLAALGLGMMVLTYQKLIRGDPQAPWGAGFLFVGDGKPAKEPKAGSLLSTRLRLLPAGPAAEALAKAVAAVTPLDRSRVEARIRPKLVELPASEMVPLEGWLREGTMPQAGRHEVLAGSQTPPGEHLRVADKPLSVVGVLRPSVALFADCYLIPASASADELFTKGDADVQPVRVLRLRPSESGNRQALVEAIEAFPSKTFTLLAPQGRPDRRAFLVYLAAQALFLLGGTGVVISLYRWLAGRVKAPLVAEPLKELSRRPRLLWSVHLVYFGLFIVGALVIYQVPDLHSVMMMAVQGEIGGGGKGVLATAGRAYQSGNILYAAAVTFVINFLIGSVAQISLPSMIIPGIGALLAIIRATLWGLLLGPSDNTLALTMLAHSGTLLLEGAGYILATFFALLMPICLFTSGQVVRKPAADEWESLEGDNPARTETAGRRFLHALALNLKGNLLVAMVLAVAACYEAVEVIVMAGL
jgi:hypothetical protein